MYFSIRLKEILKERGLKQNVLAERAGLTQASVCRILKGTRGVSLCSAMKIADVLGVSLDALCFPNAAVEKRYDHPMTDAEKLELIRSVLIEDPEWLNIIRKAATNN